MTSRLLSFALFVFASAADEEACEQDAVAAQGMAMLQRQGTQATKAHANFGMEIGAGQSELPQDVKDELATAIEHVVQAATGAEPGAAAARGSPDGAAPAAPPAFRVEGHRLVYFNWWQRNNAHKGLQCAVLGGNNQVRLQNVGRNCLKLLLNNGAGVSITTEDGKKCFEVPGGTNQIVTLRPCDGRNKRQKFVWEREQAGVIRWSGNTHQALKADGGFIKLNWANHATKFKYNPTNAGASRMQWTPEKNKCWKSKGEGQPVEFGQAPGCEYWYIEQCDAAAEEDINAECHRIRNTEGLCLDGSNGNQKATTVKPCSGDIMQIWKVMPDGKIRLFADTHKCVYGRFDQTGLYPDKFIVFLWDCHQEDAPTDFQRELWIYNSGGTENPEKSSDPSE